MTALHWLLLVSVLLSLPLVGYLTLTAYFYWGERG